uniref:Uncharacterized protein n=1 Tax=Heterorhabditis bacteriophora TaxID=37862 RepID=A0A1I7WLJ1_HETBA
MNLNDSCLSTTSTGQPAMARIVANVVDMQHNLVTQYQSIVNSLDSLKLEVHTSVQTLREDLRRSDDRAQKQVDELRRSHEKEVDRLLDLIKTLLINTQNSQSKMDQTKTPVQTYNGGAPSTNFFGVPNMSVPDSTAQYAAAAAYLQMQEQQMRLMMSQTQPIPRVGMPNQARWNGIFPPSDASNTVLAQPQPIPSTLSGPTVSLIGQSLPTVVPPAVPKPAVMTGTTIVSSSSTMTPPKPTLGIVNLPISNTLPQVVKENQVTSKQNDEKPPSLTPQLPRNSFSFSSSTATTVSGTGNTPKATTNNTLFGGVKSSSNIFGSPSGHMNIFPYSIIPMFSIFNLFRRVVSCIAFRMILKNGRNVVCEIYYSFLIHSF